MKGFHIIREEPFKTIISSEWKRARKLRTYNIGERWKFCWAKKQTLNGSYGRCYRSFKMIGLWDKYKTQTNHDELIRTIRHEIAHIGTKGHGEEFLDVMKTLGGTRWANKLEEVKFIRTV